MLIYICIFARFFQHFRDFHFLPLTSRVRVSLHLFLCKIQKATIFLSFSFSSTFSLFLYLSLVLYPPLPRYSLLSPASFLPNSVNTWWILRYYFFFYVYWTILRDRGFIRIEILRRSTAANVLRPLARSTDFGQS